MFCRHCGSFVPDGCGFCPKCGSPASDIFDDLNAGRRPKIKYDFRTLRSPSGWFGFRGRVSRKDYWIRQIVLAAILSALVLLASMLEKVSMLGELTAASAVLFTWFSMFSWVSLIVRRLHDQNYSGWLGVMFVILTLPMMAAIPYLPLLVVVAAGCLSGTRGPNRFGPEPRC